MQVILPLSFSVWQIAAVSRLPPFSVWQIAEVSADYLLHFQK